jgi:FKBP-type peptidyl-prolyl cis-trans isomerase FklB
MNRFAFALKGIMALSAVITWSAAAAPAAPLEPWNKEKVSYALGMNLGMMRKQAGTDPSPDTESFIQGLKDSLDGKPAQYREREIVPLLERTGAEGLTALPEADRKKVGYVLGLRTSAQIKFRYPEADGEVMARAINDVLQGRPTQMQESEIQAWLECAQAWGTMKQSEKNKVEGKAFLEKNAKTPGIIVLTNGLQYRVITTGTGAIPTTNDMVYMKYRGTFIDGRQFHRHGHFLTTPGGDLKCWQEALRRMPIGSKWQIFSPPELAYGEEGESHYSIGPNATLIYDLELLSLAPRDAQIGRGRLGHALEDSDIPEPEPPRQ